MALGEPCNRLIVKSDLRIVVQTEGVRHRRRDVLKTFCENRAKGLKRRIPDSFPLDRFGIRHRLKDQAFQLANNVAFDCDLTVISETGFHCVSSVQAAHQRCGPFVYKSLRQSLVEGI